MKKKELNRFGDTSFRLKNQVNFYYNIIKMIKEKNIKSYKKLWEKINEERIINYKKDSWKENRINFLIKQLKRFSVLKKGINKDFEKNNIFNQINDFSKKDIDNFFDLTGLDLINIVFGFLMLNDYEYGKNFKIFIDFLCEDNEEIFDENKIAFFEVLESKNDFEIFKKIKGKNFQINLINYLFKDINIEKIKSYVFDEIDFKELIKETDYTVNKPYRQMKEIKKLVKWINLNKEKLNTKDLEIFLENNKKTQSEINKIKKFFNITLQEIMESDINIINLFLKNKKKELIFGDYLDINKRWFTQINLLEITNGNNLKINKKYLEIYKFLSNFNLEYNLSEIIEKVKEKFKNNSIKDNVYPYEKSEILKVLKYINKNSYSEQEIFDLLKIYNVTMPTVFEYLVNLTFSISYGYSPHDFRHKYSNTILDDNLKPRRFANGRQPDGYIEDSQESNKLFSTLEATTLKNNVLHFEKESIQRHAIDLYKNKNLINKELPNCLFVSKEPINKNNIVYFSSEKLSTYCNDVNQKIRIIIIDLEMMIELLEKNKLSSLLRTVINRLPFAEEPAFQNIKNWYKELITNI